MYHVLEAAARSLESVCGLFTLVVSISSRDDLPRTDLSDIGKNTLDTWMNGIDTKEWSFYSCMGMQFMLAVGSTFVAVA
jgi:hypothetical protein